MRRGKWKSPYEPYMFLKVNDIGLMGKLTKICEIQSNLKLLEQIKKIPELTLKSVVTNQSLYIWGDGGIVNKNI